MLLAVLSIGHRAAYVKQDHSPDALFAADKQARETYHQMVTVFGGDELVLVQLRGATLEHTADLRAIRALERSIASAPGVKHVWSVMQTSAAPRDEDNQATPPDAEQVAAMRAEAEHVSLYRKLGLYRPDLPALGAAALVIMRGPEARRRLAARLERISDRFAQRGYRPLVASLATANAAIARESRRSLALFLPMTILLILLLGTLLFRSARAVVAIFLPACGAVLVGLGAFQLAGETLNIITGLMPMLVFAVGSAGSIHLMSHYALRQSDGLVTRDAVRETLEAKLTPTVFAFATTAVGFGSLGLSDVQSIRMLGFSTAWALCAALVLVTLGTPALTLLLKPRPAVPKHRRRLLADVAAWAMRHRGLVVGLAAAAAVWSVAGGQRLTNNINGMELLPKTAPERLAYQRLEAEGLGLGNIDIWIHRRIPTQQLGEAAKRLEQLAKRLQHAPLVTATIGVHDLLNAAGYRLTGKADTPIDPTAIDLLLTPEAQRQLKRLLSLYYHPTKGLKLTLLAHSTRDERAVGELRRQIREATAQIFPGAAVDISGQFSLLIGTPGSMMRTLVRSLGGTVAVIAVLFLLFFRSPRQVMAAMIVNLLPVGLVVGGMGWFAVPVDVATAMVGSLVFALAVDDTFHYLHHYRRTADIVTAAETAGQGILVASLVMIGSFAVLGLSGFAPVSRFGILTACALLIALFFDAVVLPSLLAGRPRARPLRQPRKVS